MDSINLYLDSLPEEEANQVAIVLLIIVGLLFLVLIVWYLLEALALNRMAKNRGIKRIRWFAFVPVLQNYLIGELIGDEIWGVDGAKWVLVLGPIVTSIGSSLTTNSPSPAITFLYFAWTILFEIFLYVAYFRLYQIYSKRPVVLLIFSIILPFLIPVFLFSLRNHKYNYVRKILKEDPQTVSTN